MKGDGPSQVLDIWVQPRASRNEILGFREGFLRMRVTAAPTEGEANARCLEVLAKALKVPQRNLEILSGHKARRKRIRIMGVERQALEKLGGQQDR